VSELSKAQERHRHLVAGHLDDLWTEVEEDLDAEPGVDVVLGVLATTIETTQEEWFSKASGRDLRGFEWKESGGRARSSVTAAGAVSELGDAVFTRAADFLGELVARIELDLGDKPTLEQFCKLLVSAAGIAERARALAAVEGLKASLARTEAGRVKIRIGDIVEIPSGSGGAYRAVVVARNNMGTAFGIFAGPGATMNRSPRRSIPLVLYSGERALKEGRWRIIGRDEAALAAFPAVPEIYYQKDLDPGNPELGAFGGAKAPGGGAMRQISREEAQEVGLLDGTYNTTYLEDFLVQWLDQNRARFWPALN